MHPPQGNSQHAQPEGDGGGPNATGVRQSEGEDDQDDERGMQPQSQSQDQVTRTMAVDKGASALAAAAYADPATRDPVGWLAKAKAAFSRYVEDGRADRRPGARKRYRKCHLAENLFPASLARPMLQDTPISIDVCSVNLPKSCSTTPADRSFSLLTSTPRVVPCRPAHCFRHLVWHRQARFALCGSPLPLGFGPDCYRCVSPSVPYLHLSLWNGAL